MTTPTLRGLCLDGALCALAGTAAAQPLPFDIYWVDGEGAPRRAPA